MVWIHGGGNTVGHGGFYDGGPLAAREGVVVVTLNYRLGPLGWFHHPALVGDDAADASGNYGTLDLVRALAWIREEIAVFGGDPERVILFGESAGGTNITSLLVAPAARGLFHGAISQSGGTGSVSVAEASHERDAAEPGLPSSSAEIVLRLLQQDGGDDCDRACARTRLAAMTPDDLAGRLRRLGVAELFALYGDAGLMGPDSPAVIRDGAVLPTEPFLELLGDPKTSNAVPMILGTNRDESKIFMAFDPDQVVRLFGLPLWRRDPQGYDLQAEYSARAWKLRGVDDPAQRLRAGGVPVWTYRWDWDEEGRRFGVNLSALLGAAHGLEIPFVFGHWDVGPQSGLLYNDDNAPGRLALSAQMMGYWAAFARDLDPGTGAGTAPRWAPFDPAAGRSHLRLDTGPDGIRMDDALVTFEGLIEDLATDPRVRDADERCALLRASFAFDDSNRLATASQRLGCAD
jgi:para-nitrobenzyl esterase